MFLEWWLYITTSSLIFWEQMAMKSKNHLDNQFCGGFVAIFDTRAFLTMGFVGLICNGRIKLRSLKMGDLQWWQVFKHMLPKSHITFDIGNWLLDHANLELFQIKIYLDLDLLLSNSLIDIIYLISKWTTQEMPRLLAHNLIHHFVSNMTWNCKEG